MDGYNGLCAVIFDDVGEACHENSPKVQVEHAAAEAEAQAQLQKAERLADEAQQRVQAAEERASAAELAKIQLSMQLAEQDDRRPLNLKAEAGVDGAEESFAQSVTARRAATAEREVEELRQKLSEADSAITQLEFQVTSNPLLVTKMHLPAQVPCA